LIFLDYVKLVKINHLIKSMKIIILKGLPASGKTTWAKEQKGYKRINKDDLRAMIDNGRWSRGNEKLILRVRDEIIKECLTNEKSVIIDDTNFAEKHIERIKQIAFAYNAEVEIKDFDVNVNECIRRDKERKNPVGQKVIQDMYYKYIKKDIEPIKWVSKRKTAIICDIDGTLAKMINRSPFDWSKVGNDKLVLPVADILDKYKDSVDIILLSGRDGICKEETKEWLMNNSVKYNHLFMRDVNNNEKDSIIKERIYKEKIAPNYNILFVLDDRNQVVNMWRNLGLTCFQVNEGNF